MKNYRSIQEYIMSFPPEIQEKLNQMYRTIKNVAPNAEEGISYGMPAFKLNQKPLVYFAAQKQHIGFYATPTGHAAFAEELKGYKQGKGSVQFPFSEEIPLQLVERITEFRVAENIKKDGLH